MPAPDTKCSPRPRPTTRTAGAAAPAGRGRPAGQPCYAVPAAPAQGGAVPPAAAGAGARRPEGRRPHRLCAILPRRPPPSPPPGADGASPAGQVAARRPRALPPRRAVRHRPGPAAQRREGGREGKGTGRCRPAPQRYRHRYRTSARLTLRSAPLRSPQPGGGGGPCRWEKARRAAPSPLRAQPPPNRSARRVPAGAAARPRVGRRRSAGPPRPPPASPGRGLPHGHRGPRGPPVGRFTAELAGCPVGTKPSLGALPALARGLPDAPREGERRSRLPAAPQGEGRWPPVPRVGGCTLKRHAEVRAAKAGGREKRQEAAAAFHIPSR